MVVPSLVTAGMEMVVATLVRALARRGHEVGVTCTEKVGAIGEQLRSEGFSVELIPAPGILTNVWPRALARWLATRNPDVVHVHSGVWLKAARAARMAGRVPLVHTVHGLMDDLSSIERPYQLAASFLTNSIVAVSQSLREDLTRRVGIPESKVSVVVNGIDTGRFAPRARTNALRERLNLDDSHFVVGHVGRFAPVKNQAMLIDAFAVVSAKLPSARLVLVGDGPLRDDLEKRARERGVETLVHFVGEQRDLAPILGDIDVFVLCSLSEGTSIALLEAMACGVPCIATDVGGNGAVLNRGEAGALVSSGDVAALAASVTRVLTSADLAKAYSLAGRSRAQSDYSESAMVRQYEEIYDALV